MKKDSLIKDIIETILLSCLITFVLLNYVCIICRVQGTSMTPIIHDKDILLSSIISKKQLNRFDICIVKVSEESKEKKLVKRLIGLPNEEIEYKDNKLYVNGEFIKEDFLPETYTNDFSIKLSEDQYYFLGDNRIHSNDSRYYGPFNSENIIASKIFVFYPFDNFGVKK